MKSRLNKITFVIGISAFVIGSCCGAIIYPVLHEIFFERGERQANIQEWLGTAQGRYTNVAAVRAGPEPEGVILKLAVKIEPHGEGYIYVNIDPMLVGFDFQDASRKATKVSCAKTDYSLDKDGVGIYGQDIFFLVSAASSEEIAVQAIDGPSAGTATAIAILATLENKKIKEDYMITGTIEEDGSIGKVGGIFYKAEAAKNAGVTHFLVPPGQSSVMMYKRVVYERFGVRWVTYKPEWIDLNQYAKKQGWKNFEVREVSTIDQAVDLMLQ